jgi:imidazolonepropionase-like amidohydrolase
LNSQHLVFEAAKAHHYGLTEQEAFQTVTSVPANTIGLGHRIGSLKVGYDADVVIWDRSPLELGAAPLQVFVDGVPLFDEKNIDPVVENTPTNKAKSTTVSTAAAAAAAGKSSFVLTNIGRNFLSEAHGNDDDSVLVVDNGKIVCSGQCTHALGDNVQEIDINGGYVVPVSMMCSCRLPFILLTLFE